MIEAALLRPQTGYYRDLIEEAAALWESLTMNHGFFDGNKRVAFAAMEIFLDLNGFELRATEKHAISLVYGLLESSNFNKNELESWLRTYAHRL